MKRIATTLLALAAIGAFVVLSTGASGGDQDAHTYWAEFDNAFGLIKGGDLKVAGVRAGKITDLKLDRKTKRALVGFQITENGFGSLRRDVHCESRPQSLIGEYFVDCLPGTDKTEWKADQVIPVDHTASTVAPDLVNNIMRRPYRERLSIIVNELGAGVAGNAEQLNDAIRRAHPALRETDKVLATLARQNKILADLALNADRVIGDMANNHKDVGRFVLEARNASKASAARDTAISEGWRRLPGFLRELRPTMAQLGRTADAQTPSLRDLNASAGQLEGLFKNLKPFAEASGPAIQSLGRASVTGRRAMRAAGPTIDELKRFASGAPELGKNLAIILEHLDSRENAAEKDPRSPGGNGYTGLEALLTYVYDQTLSTNVYDSNTHILKVAIFKNKCADFYDAKKVRDHPEDAKECAATLGPNQPGINFPDVTEREGVYQARAERDARAKRIDGQRTPDAGPAPADQTPSKQDGGGQGDAPKTPDAPIQVPDVLPDLPGGPSLPELPKGVTPDTITKTLGLASQLADDTDRRRQTQLLDYLFAP